MQTRIVENDDVVEALTEEARAHDVTTFGAESERILQKLVFGAVPETVGDRVEDTVIVCQREVGAPSRLKRLFT